MAETTAPAKNQNAPAANKEQENKPAIIGNHQPGTQIAKANNTQVERFVAVDLNVDATELPDLDAAKELPLDLMSSYWTPEKEGETKNVFFSHIEDSELLDEETGQVKILRTAFFYQKQGPEMKTIRNASKKLVGALENNGIKWGTPLRITYLGKKKNLTNAFKSDDWMVKPLLIEVK